MRSLAMTIDSACVTRLQLCPALLRAVDITTYPLLNASTGAPLPVRSLVTLGASLLCRSMPQLCP